MLRSLTPAPAGHVQPVRALALGDPALAGLRHTSGYWGLVSLAWAAGITVLFAPLTVLQFQRARVTGSSPH